MASVCKSCSNTKCQMYGEAFMQTCKEYVPMGVEERAEQYAIKEICGNCNHCQSKGYIGCDTYRYGKNAYIAGYNACLEEATHNYNKLIDEREKLIPKWHKVADGDLPKEGVLCAVLLVNNDLILARLREDNVWTTNGHNAFENVIAWCEIPRYEGV